MIKPTIAQKDVTKHILKTFNIRMSKKLGQNFLVDEKIVRGIVQAADISPGDTVLEIGPGIGTLTQGLAEAGAQVVAVELDLKLIDVLAETLAGYDNVRIIHGDILKVDIAAEVPAAPFKVVANLPYYITTPIIMGLLEARLPVSVLVTMIQKEVAARMVACPGTKDYGALSVAVQYFTQPRMMFDVPPVSFIPSPAVDSAVIRCLVRDQPAVAVADEKLFFRVVKAAFSQRRKTLNNALKTGIPADQIQPALAAAGIDGARRGETLSLQEFAALANCLK
ncbi:16S rRNA (adenine(1518)-N(6)/adenine(1519)-N(6))-dimethyltransferase RsmA|uniref:Ribosomal RNA small subunit methyltransferase A n=1 Tax=Dendrosporobacter quercicolus TaxID=146817 RepID=A0A1G9QNQ1_9FIRM|nr:16S rRNA (adenine(1518)-N(6)/adenine(1519)-N(6))-dimethyltransferase RsmA [Dendrosporobacter quercicolus]NSL48311.1 16S rRNA (adenine(1518)-N(6)/adenine(1519)-N(6))-dimethyltransferase RsmA [Dendrosporobacter quercicolus DSM 1736]SDM12626.1 16S rRNA (adenine1518-N6/adenine1519-N6)-dimethyltransferase [Dendrosporobacter quercicolus]